jgi:signal transduction histidine kinase
MLSLRARVVLGALFWTVGLLIVGTTILVLAIEHFGEFRHFLEIHDVFKNPVALFLAICSMGVGIWQVRRGLAGIAQLRGRLGAIHDGRDARVDGRYVPEVQPLVDDLNTLLEHREQAVRRAVAKAGDLAHGLKTPLAVLAHESERAAAAGQPEVAAAIAQQVERMRRQIDYHLAHARAAASGAIPGARSSVKESADGLARTLARLHAERHLSIDVRVAPAHVARVQREDLDEMLGNLLDNACKWARKDISVDSALVEGSVLVTVDDDGPGLAVPMREAVLQRGVRADEKASGHGLGLAIVRDLAELYGGSIALRDSARGGLRAALTLPAA